MCGLDSSGSHIHLLTPHIGSQPSGCPEDRHSLCGRIWQHALGGRSELNPCASPAGIRTECAAGNLKWSIFSTSKVSIFVLSETYLNQGQALRLANYVCHRTDKPTAAGGRAIRVRRGLVHHSVPIPGLTHFDATAVQVTMAAKPVKIFAAYLSPSHH